MKRIAIIEDGYVRDTQVFTENPDIISEDSDWEDYFSDIKYPSLYIGIFEGDTEDEIKTKAAEREGVHPGIITLVSFEQTTNNDTPATGKPFIG